MTVEIYLDNTFVDIDNFEKAQEIANQFDVERLHQILDDLAKKYCPVIDTLQLNYHWTIMQLEYATDIVFFQKEYL